MIIKNYNYSETIFNIDFSDKVNVLDDYSGTGKTFLMSMLSSYCEENNIPYIYIDYRMKNSILLNELSNCKVLLFDQADLYMDFNMFEKIKNLNAISIISIKSTSNLDMSEEVGEYILNNDGYVISTKKVG